MTNKRRSCVIKVKIKKVLVPLDGSKYAFEALNEAIYLARQCGSTVTGLYVVPFYPGNLGDLIGPLKARLYGDAKTILKKARVICAQNGIAFKEKIAYGDAKSEIPDFAKAGNFDLIVIGSRGLTPVKEMFLGSVSNAVSHKSKVPVLVVK